MRKHIETSGNRLFVIRDISEESSVSVTISPALAEEELREELERRGVLAHEAEGLIERAKLEGTKTSCSRLAGFSLRN